MYPINTPCKYTLTHSINLPCITANEKGLVLTSVQDIVAYRVEMEYIDISKE